MRRLHRDATGNLKVHIRGTNNNVMKPAAASYKFSSKHFTSLRICMHLLPWREYKFQEHTAHLVWRVFAKLLVGERLGSPDIV